MVRRAAGMKNSNYRPAARMFTYEIGQGQQPEGLALDS